ncbi:MAG: hypothetical protein J6K51_00945 [Clostridia bacterium]|nr:hypothetical protein [Clostridia bacterium]
MKWLNQLQSKLNLKVKNKSAFIVLLFLAGAILLLLPSPEKKQAFSDPQVNMINQTDQTKKELEKLLTKLVGCKVRVLITYADSGEIEVIQEENISTQTQKDITQSQKETKPTLDSNKNILVKKRSQPNIKGVSVFCFSPYQASLADTLCRGAAQALGAPLHTVEVVFQPIT